jgi:hypothetical protein
VAAAERPGRQTRLAGSLAAWLQSWGVRQTKPGLARPANLAARCGPPTHPPGLRRRFFSPPASPPENRKPKQKANGLLAGDPDPDFSTFRFSNQKIDAQKIAADPGEGGRLGGSST